MASARRRLPALFGRRILLEFFVFLAKSFDTAGRIQKFLFPGEIGAGRFAKIGLPSPEFLGPFVGTFEIVCGFLVVLGLLTRLAVLPLIVIMIVAISSTKVPILLEKGFWVMAHESRTDFAMLLGSVFLLSVGAGSWSIDERLKKGR